MSVSWKMRIRKKLNFKEDEIMKTREQVIIEKLQDEEKKLFKTVRNFEDQLEWQVVNLGEENLTTRALHDSYNTRWVTVFGLMRDLGIESIYDEEDY